VPGRESRTKSRAGPPGTTAFLEPGSGGLACSRRVSCPQQRRRGSLRYRARSAFATQPRRYLDASMFLDLHRLPELFCGFRRVEGNGPTLYPVACSPQAWASGAAFMMLAACLGLSVDGVRRIVRIHKPTLPESVQRISITDLKVGTSMVNLLFHRDDEDVGVLVRRRQGPVSVQIEK
jgi:hypothetical protein